MWRTAGGARPGFLRIRQVITVDHSLGGGLGAYAHIHDRPSRAARRRGDPPLVRPARPSVRTRRLRVLHPVRPRLRSRQPTRRRRPARLPLRPRGRSRAGHRLRRAQRHERRGHGRADARQRQPGAERRRRPAPPPLYPRRLHPARLRENPAVSLRRQRRPRGPGRPRLSRPARGAAARGARDLRTQHARELRARLGQCPGTPSGARVDAKGCPNDGDADGVPDGVDQCPNTPAGAVVDAAGCPLDSDKDGVPDGLDKCPNTPPGTEVDAVGCTRVTDSDGDGVDDTKDKCPGTAPGTRVDAAGCPILFTPERTPVILRGVTFETGRSALKLESHTVLDIVAQSLLDNPDIRIEIAGYTDSTGAPATNLRLSQARAAAVRAYLAGRGVAPGRMVARGYGAAKPIAPNTTLDGRAQNRRVELHQLPYAHRRAGAVYEEARGAGGGADALGPGSRGPAGPSVRDRGVRLIHAVRPGVRAREEGRRRRALRLLRGRRRGPRRGGAVPAELPRAPDQLHARADHRQREPRGEPALRRAQRVLRAGGLLTPRLRQYRTLQVHRQRDARGGGRSHLPHEPRRAPSRGARLLHTQHAVVLRLVGHALGRDRRRLLLRVGAPREGFGPGRGGRFRGQVPRHPRRRQGRRARLSHRHR